MCGRFHFNGNDKDIQKILDYLPESEKNVQIKFGDIYPTYYLPIALGITTSPNLYSPMYLRLVRMRNTAL